VRDASDSSTARFNGTIEIRGGAVALGDGFLRTNQSGSGTTIKLFPNNPEVFDEEGNTIPGSEIRLFVGGLNVVTGIVEDLSKASKLKGAYKREWLPKIEGGAANPGTDGELELGGTLVLELGASSLELYSQLGGPLPDFSMGSAGEAAPLTLLKRGTGVLTLLNPLNTFSGGMIVEGGTLAVIDGGSLINEVTPAGVLGAGTLILSGGPAGATLLFGSLSSSRVTSGSLYNAVTLRGGSVSNTPSKGIIRGASPGTTLDLKGPVLVEAEGSSLFDSKPTNYILDLQIPLTISDSLSVSGILTLTGGSSLSLLPPDSDNSSATRSYLGDFILQNGTLAIGVNTEDSGISINGSPGSRKLVALGAGVVVSAGRDTILPVWESSFSFAGNGHRLEITEGSTGQNAVALKGRIEVTVESGTLAIGGVQRATGADSAVLVKYGQGTLEFKGALGSGDSGLTGLQLAGPVAFSSLTPVAFSSPVTLSEIPELRVLGGAKLSLTGAVSGTGFTKTGIGELALGGSYSLSSPIIVRAGLLSLASGGTQIELGDAQTVAGDAPTLSSVESASLTGSIKLNAAARLQATNGTVLDLSGAWTTGNNSINVGNTARAGTVRFSSVVSTSGGITLNNGVLQMGIDNAIGSSPLTVSGGTLQLAGKNLQVSSLSGAGTVENGASSLATLTVSSDADMLAFTGKFRDGGVSGKLAVVKEGQGTFELNGAADHSGGTTINAGVLRMGANGTLSAASKVTVGTGATFSLGGKSVTLAEFVDAGGTVADGNLTATTFGVKGVASNGTFGNQGLTLGGGQTIAGVQSLYSEGTMNLTLSQNATLNLSGTGIINLSASQPYKLTLGQTSDMTGTLVLGNNVTLGFSKNELLKGVTLTIGTGARVELDGTSQQIASLNFLAGGTLVGTGTVNYGSIALPDGNGELLNDDQSVRNTNFAPASGVTFTVTSKTEAIQNGIKVIAGSAPELASGTQRLQIEPEKDATRVTINKALTIVSAIDANVKAGNSVGLVSIDNTLTLLSGSITFGQGIQATLTQNGALNASGLVNSGSLTLNFGAQKTVQIPIHGSGSLTKTGAGAATLTGNNSYTGGTTLSAGVLELGNQAALGTQGAIRFTGGTLRYGQGIATDLASRISATSGSAANIDTATNTVTYNGDITSANVNAGIAKFGSGALILTGNNSFTGGATVRAGMLQIGNGGATGTMAAAASVDGGALLRFLSSNDVPYSGAISGAGTVEQAGSGLLTIDGSNGAFTGKLLLTSGATALANSTALGNGAAKINFNGGILRYLSSADDFSSKIEGTGSTASIDTYGQTISHATGLTGSGGLNKLGAGTLLLQVDNSFSGPTTISAGLLRAGTALSSTNEINVNGGRFEAESYNPAAVLKVGVNGMALLTGATASFGTIINDGNVLFSNQTGTDVLIGTLSGTGNSTVEGSAGIRDVQGGSITINGTGIIERLAGGGVSVSDFSSVKNFTGGTLQVGLQSQTTVENLGNGTIVNRGRLEVLNGDSISSISGVGSLTKTDSGILTLGGLLTYTGATKVGQGTLVLTGAANLDGSQGLEVSGGATAQISSAAVALKQLTGTGSINLVGTSLSVSTGAFDGAILGSGTLHKTGTETLSIANAPSGQISVNVKAGTLSAAANLLTDTRAVNVLGGAQLNNAVSTGSFSGRLTGAGSTLLNGAGTLTLEASSFVQGALTLGAGVTLDISKTNQQLGGGGLDPALTLMLLGSSTLKLGEQEVELQTLKLLPSAALFSSGTSKIYYDDVPAVLLNNGTLAPLVDSNNQLIAANAGLVSISPLTSFEENSKPGSIFGNGTYQFIAGRVKNIPLAGDTDGVKRLLLDPLQGKTIRISGAIPNVSQEIVATGTGTGGFVSVGTLVTTPRFVIGSGIVATFTQNGALAETGTFLNSGTLQFAVSSGASKTVGNLISGAGRLEKIDEGLLSLTGANTYTGQTRLTRGVLQLDNASALGSESGQIVFNGGTVRYGTPFTADLSKRIQAIESGIIGGVDTGGKTVRFDTGLSGQGGLAKLGEGHLLLAGSNRFTGPLGVFAGTVTVGASTAGSLDAEYVYVENGALLSFARSDKTAYAGEFVGLGRIEQAGDGTLELTGNGEDFEGTFALRRGTVLIGGAQTLAGGTIRFEGGTLKYGISNPSDLSLQFGSLTATALVDTGTHNLSYARGLQGTAGFTKYGTGSLTFEGQNTYAGLTTVAAGSLVYTGSAALSTSGTINAQAGTRVSLELQAGTGDFNAKVTGAGALAKIGAGAVTLRDGPVNTGGAFVQGGSLVLGDKVRLGGRIDLDRGTVLNTTNGILENAPVLALSGTLQLGDGVVFLKSINLLEGGSVKLDSALPADGSAFATVLAESLTNLPSSSLGDDSTFSVGTFTAGRVEGALRGAIKGIPSGTGLVLRSSGRPVSLSDSNMRLNSLDADPGVLLKVEQEVFVEGNVFIKGGTLGSRLDVESDLRVPTGSVILGGSLNGNNLVTSGSVSATVGTVANNGTSNGSITAKQLTLTGSSALTVNNLDGLQGVQTLEVGTSRGDATLVVREGGTLTVAPGQTLKGSGLISGNLALGEGGVLSPGNSPGTLNVAGTLNLVSGLVRLEVGTLAGGTLVQDRIAVTVSAGTNSGGPVTIGGNGGGPTFQIVDTDGRLANGGSLGSIFVDGSGNALQPVVGNSGTFTFTFARQSSTGAVLPSVMFTSTGTFNALQIQRLRFASFAGSARNIAGFARSVDTRIITQRANTDGLLELGTGITSTAAVPAQLAAALPVAYAELAALSTQRTLNIHQGLVGHFSSVRTNILDMPEGALNAWTTGYGAGHWQNGNSSLGKAGFNASTWGDLLGIEQRIGNFLLGVTGAVGRTSANFQANPGNATTDSWHGGVYSVLDFEHFVLESGAMFGGTDSRANRTISAPGLTQRQGRVNLNGTEWVANTGVAIPASLTPDFTITPSARFIAQGQSHGAARESDMSGLEVQLSKQSTVTYQHQAGVEARHKFNFTGRPAAASMQLDWIHNYNARGRNLNMALSGDPSAMFGYQGSSAGADAFRVATALETALTERTSFRAGVEYQAQTSLSTVRGSLSIGYQF
jgi:autotransporter-associated beta strand protein